MKVIYRERKMIDRFTCIDTVKDFKAISYFKPEDTGLYYFRVNAYEYKTISEEDLMDIIK